jgi:hypothetical protein
MQCPQCYNVLIFLLPKLCLPSVDHLSNRVINYIEYFAFILCAPCPEMIVFSNKLSLWKFEMCMLFLLQRGGNALDFTHLHYFVVAVVSVSYCEPH